MINKVEHLAIFDTHTHLNVAEFQGHEAEELALAQDMGVAYHNVVGFDQATIEGALALADKYPNVYATIGWHPTEAGSYSQAVEEAIVSQLSLSLIHI